MPWLGSAQNLVNQVRKIRTSPTHHVVPVFCPRSRFATRRGWQTAPHGSDQFTGMSKDIMMARRENLCFVKHRDRVEQYRQTILRIANAKMENDEVLHTFEELPNVDQICATGTPPVNKGKLKKRDGARKSRTSRRQELSKTVP